MTGLALAIDPGSAESAYAVVDVTTCRPVAFDKVPNEQLLEQLDGFDFNYRGGFVDQPICLAAIEMVASYGMAVGAEVFDTCVWIGRFQQAFYTHGDPGFPVDRIKRHPVKLHHCHATNASDANIAQALKDRFAYGVRNHGKGTKAEPGWFYGFAADVWQAYALAVYIADTHPAITLATPDRPSAATSTPAADGHPTQAVS